MSDRASLPASRDDDLAREPETSGGTCEECGCDPDQPFRCGCFSPWCPCSDPERDDPDGYDRSGASDGFTVSSDALEGF